MSLNRSEELSTLALDVKKTLVHAALKWEPNLREDKELVSEFIEEKIGRDILSNIDKYKDAYEVVRSRTNRDKHRIVVNLSLLQQLKQLQAIADYLNQYHAPEGRRTWEVARVVTGDSISYPLFYTNYPVSDTRFSPIHDQLYKWLDQPKIAEMFRNIKPEYHRHRVLYVIKDAELLKELSLLVQTKSFQSPKP